MKKTLFAVAAGLTIVTSAHAAQPYDADVFTAASKIQSKVVAWRRDIHEHPELSNQEERTGKLVAEHLRRLGFEVRTGIAKTGVIGILRGANPGRVVALRADMDGLPVAEQTGLPFASKVTTDWAGKSVPVMHACGHDSHVAMLMGAAEILASMKAQIHGTVVLVFQPAEEGPPNGEEGGAPQIVKEKALADPKPDAVFGIHVWPGKTGELIWRPGPFMAGSDTWELSVKGRQTHGAMPWAGVDAASVAADIVTSFNQLTARQLNVSRAPTILTVGEIRLGTRHNIIPGSFEMTGTLRTFDPEMRKDVLARIDNTLKSIGTKYGATLEMRYKASNPVTEDDRALSMQMKPTLLRASRDSARDDYDYVMASEDFSAYQAVAPTMFYFLGIGPSAPNHSPMFSIEESAMEVGVRAHVLSALDFLSNAAPTPGAK
jgi:amidohydrolase